MIRQTQARALMGGVRANLRSDCFVGVPGVPVSERYMYEQAILL